MKKLFSFILLAFSLNLYAQEVSNETGMAPKTCCANVFSGKCCDSTKTFEPKRRQFNQFMSLSFGLDANQQTSHTVEYGLWGDKMPLMISVSATNFMLNPNQIIYGLNTYFEVFEKDNNQLYLYGGPKTDFKTMYIDYGFTYYTRVLGLWPCVSVGLSGTPSYNVGINYIY